ncbi:MAG: hypothetical protein ACOC2Y_07355 [Spirochaetota bacterium]
MERALQVLAEIDRSTFGRVPLVWSLPSGDACAHSDGPSKSFLQAFRERAERYGDELWPAGLTGAPNAPLLIDEIAAEIEWSVSNLWNTGVRDRLRTDPRFILPVSPDVVRSEAAEAYSGAPVAVALFAYANDGPWLRLIPREPVSSDASLAERAAPGWPVVEPNSIEPEAITRRLLAREVQRRGRAARAWGQARQMVVRCTLETGHDAERLFALMSAMVELTERGGWRVAVPSLERAAPDSPVPISTETRLLAPDVGAKAMDLRRRRGSKINTRRVLERFASCGSSEEELAHAPEPPETGRRDFVASMTGQSSLPGANVQATFAGGRYCGLSGSASPESRASVDPRRAAENRLRPAAGDEIADTVESCFSFETEISRGLRSEAAILDPDRRTSVRVRTEYSLVGEIDALVVSQHVILEGGDPADTADVLAIPVLDSDRCAVTGRFTDESTYDYDVRWDRGRISLWAEAFQIWDGESSTTVVPLTLSAYPRPWSVTIAPSPRHRLVLGGSYAMGSAAHHHVSFLIVRGDLDDELVEKALAGRLPAPIHQEITAGTAAEPAMNAPVAKEPQGA